MEEGSIVRIALPQSNGNLRSRPALILKKVKPYDDYLLCSISSKIHNEIKDLDIVIGIEHPDFVSSRLKYPGLIRTANLFTIPASLIEGKIGFISEQTHDKILQNLSKFILNRRKQ